MNLDKFMNNLNQDPAETIKHLNSLKHSDPTNPGDEHQLQKAASIAADPTEPTSVRAAALDAIFTAYATPVHASGTFKNCTFTGFVFPNADYQDSTFTGTITGIYGRLGLTTTDFTGATLPGLVLIGCDTRGMRINPEQISSLMLTRATIPTGDTYPAVCLNLEKNKELLAHVMGHTEN